MFSFYCTSYLLILACLLNVMNTHKCHKHNLKGITCRIVTRLKLVRDQCGKGRRDGISHREMGISCPTLGIGRDAEADSRSRSRLGIARFPAWPLGNFPLRVGKSRPVPCTFVGAIKISFFFIMIIDFPLLLVWIFWSKNLFA